MTTLKKFLNIDEANLCASFLQNAGIDASVFEDTAFGGGIDAIEGTNRIVVPEEQLDEAKELLKEYQKGDDVEG
jgi:hypothetical protein